MEVKGELIELALWEVPAHEEYRFTPFVYSGAHAFLLCFSVDDPDTLERIIDRWDPEIKHFGAGGVPRFLVACKKDLRDDINTIRRLERTGEVPVSAERGKEVACVIGATYLECSSKTGEGVREVFQTATESMAAGIEVAKYKEESSFRKGRHRNGGCVVL